MRYPIKICAICSEEFELKPDKPGFANHCPDCTESEASNPRRGSEERETNSELNEARRRAMRELLYRKDN